MERKAQDRIRGYFYKTKEELTKSEIYKTDKSAKLLLDNLLDDFFLFLNGVDYFSCLFNRKCKNHYTNLLKSQDNIDGTIKRKIPPRKRIKLEVKKQLSNVDLFKKYSVTLCNKTGDFNCHGVWYDSKCSYSHSINPYASRENLIFFQTYNLDHQIEISRTILPSILENAKNLAKQENCSIHKKIGSSLSTITYFLEIFTMRNLKLVNIICHDKAIHQKRSKGRIICENCREFKFIEKIKREINSP
jgi:DNA fragmentation factor beta subunit